MLIGTSDLSIELGIPGQFEDQRIVDAYRTVVDACRAHDKFAGIGGIYEDALLRRYIGMGVRLVIGGGDLGFMQAAASARASQLRGCLLRALAWCAFRSFKPSFPRKRSRTIGLNPRLRGGDEGWCDVRG